MLGDQRLGGSREDADAAFRSLSAEHGPTLLRLSTVLTEGDRHRVEDMVQESMLRAWKLRADLNIEHHSPRGWLITVARQLAVDARRARQTRPPEAELDDPLASAASNPTPASTRRMIAVAKVSLPLGRRLAGFGLAAAAVVAVTPAVSLLARNAVGRTMQAGRAAAECELLATGAASVLRGPDAFTALLGQARESSRMDSVTLLERGPSAGDATGRAVGWTPVAVSGGSPVARLSDAALTVLATSGLCLALGGRALPATGRRILSAFAAFAAAALGRQRLAAVAETARTIAQADRMRIALLAAVSHDLRTPLAAARAAVSCLRSGDIKLTAADHDELLASAEESLNQLGRLISSLLDVSRLQAGALPVFPRPADLGQIIALSLDELGPQERAVMVELPPDLPQVMVDAPIMERVIANVTANALRYSPRRSPPLLTASARGDRVELRVIDRGPGIPKAERSSGCPAHPLCSRSCLAASSTAWHCPLSGTPADGQHEPRQTRNVTDRQPRPPRDPPYLHPGGWGVTLGRDGCISEYCVCLGRVGRAAVGDALRVLEGFALAPVLSQLSVLLTADRLREVRNQASSREFSEGRPSSADINI